MNKLIIGLLLLSSCLSKPKQVDQKQDKIWYKGNTHVHTTLCGHADSHPDTVATWYLDRGYNFLILSEHEKFIDPKTVNLPEDRREDFILIPGEEVSDHEAIHTTAMNVNRLVPTHRLLGLPKPKDNPFENFKIYLMQKHVDSIRGAGGIPILNHPNWQSGASAAEILQVEGLNMIELYNGHPDVNNWGSEKHASMEVKWDSLLTAGKKVYGVSSDDAHSFKEWSVDVSNPGRGWVMVQSEELSPEAITSAMVKGDFYASNGVILSEVDASKKYYSITIDTIATYKTTENPYVVGHKTEKSKAGFKIEFISDDGEVIHTSTGISAQFDVPTGVTYLRGKVTYSRDRSSKSEQFYAWTQPVFLK